MIKFGVIGSGWIAEEFVKGTGYVDGLEFSAMYSRKSETGKKFASQFADVPVYTDLEEFAKGDFDAVYIASPNCFHYEQSKLMLENGKHILCEKPITVTPNEFSELRKFADSKKLVYTEAIMMLHNPVEKLIKNELKNLGKITTAHFDFSQLSSKYSALKNGENPNIFNPEMKTGCLRDLGIYCFYPALDFFGKPESIISSAGFLETGADGFGTAILNYADKQITLTYSKTGQDYRGSQIFGDKGTMVIDSISKLTGTRIIYNDGTEKTISEDTEKAVLMSYEAKDFLDYINFYDEMNEKYNEINDKIFEVNKMIFEVKNQCKII